MKPVHAALAIALTLACQSGFGQAAQLQPLAGFGTNGNGAILPGQRPYLTSDGHAYQRGLAYNPVTGHLLVVNRYPVGGETINILNGTNGADLGQLDTSALVLGDNFNYYITPTRIPTDMYYKPPSIGGSPTWYTYGNPGYDKTGGRGDWTYIVWSCVQNGGLSYPDNVNHGGGLVRALGKRDAIFSRCDVQPIIGISYGPGDVQNGVVTSIYGRTQAGTGSWIYGWLVYSYQETGQPLVPCVRRFSSGQAANLRFEPAAPAGLKRMSENLLKGELTLDASSAALLRATWTNRFAIQPDPLARMEIITETPQLDDPRTIRMLLDLLPQEQDSRVRQQIILILGFMRTTDSQLGAVTAAMKTLLPGVKVAQERERMFEMISNFPRPEAATLVGDAFAATENSAEDKILAAQALFKLAPRVAVRPEILQQAGDWLRLQAKTAPDAKTRLEAARVLAAPRQQNQTFLSDLLNSEGNRDVKSFLTLAAEPFPTR